MSRLLRQLRNERGTTLLELLITMTVLGVLIAIFSQVFASTVKHSNEVQEESILQTEVRGTVDQLAEDLRAATNGDSTVPIEVMTATTLQFLSPDRVSSYHMRRIAYQLVSHNLQRAVTTSTDTDGSPWVLGWSTPPSTAWVTQVGSVRNSAVFTYLDGNGAATATAASVRTVKISVSVSPNGSQARQYNYANSATLRTTQ